MDYSIKDTLGVMMTGVYRSGTEYALQLLHEIDKRKKTQITDDEIELITFIGQTIGSE